MRLFFCCNIEGLPNVCDFKRRNRTMMKTREEVLKRKKKKRRKKRAKRSTARFCTMFTQGRAN